MKKYYKLFFISTLLLCLVSCTDKINSQTSVKDSSDPVTEITEVSEKTSISESQISTNADSVSSSKLPAVTSEAVTKADIPEMSYDFEGLVSQKYVQALTTKNYVMTYAIPEMKITQRICLDGDNVFSTFTNDGMSYDMLYKDNVQYMIYKQNYSKVEVSGTADNLVKIFSEIGYVESGETEYDGEKCRYDEFYQTAFDTRIKLIINEAGEFVAFDQEGTIAEINEFSTQADKSLFTIPESYKEVDMDTIQQLFYDEYSSANGTK